MILKQTLKQYFILLSRIRLPIAEVSCQKIIKVKSESQWSWPWSVLEREWKRSRGSVGQRRQSDVNQLQPTTMQNTTHLYGNQSH